MQYSPIIQASELAQLYRLSRPVVIHAGNGPDAQTAYAQGHLAGAYFVELDTELANVGPDPSKGGRHPLPDLHSFGRLLADIGITPASHVVIYDTLGGANAAARMWWMLKAVGHQKVQVLNGGFQAAEQRSLPLDTEKVQRKKSFKYPVSKWSLPIADIDEVARVAEKDDHYVIDVRSAERHRGETEPIDLIAGHIPGAINVPFSENLDSDGCYWPSDLMKKKYLAHLRQVDVENVIVHCGSGVTACHTILAFAHAGLRIPKLYVGSWSEWSRSDKAIATTTTSK